MLIVRKSDGALLGELNVQVTDDAPYIRVAIQPPMLVPRNIAYRGPPQAAYDSVVIELDRGQPVGGIVGWVSADDLLKRDRRYYPATEGERRQIKRRLEQLAHLPLGRHLGRPDYITVLNSPTTSPSTTRPTRAASAMWIGDSFTQATILAFSIVWLPF